MSSLTPTDEQAACLELFGTGESMVIEAGAGTGKTSTLRLLADSTRRHGQYVAFNKAIVTEAQTKFPSHVGASTAHSLAFRAVGKPYARRLRAARMKSRDVARRLNLSPFTVRYGAQTKVLADGYLAGLVMRAVTRFCQTADAEPDGRHVPYVDGIDLPTADGKRTWANNEALRRHLASAVRAAWADVTRVDGTLPFKHEHYLKLYQLSSPTLPVDYVLFDEAQDANPVIAAIVAAQEHAQLVYVGDSQQAIYEWTGAVNAMAGFAPEHRRPLTRSFRFGPGIAQVANGILDRLSSPLRLEGVGGASTVGLLDPSDADVVLCRTNARAVQTLLDGLNREQTVHLVGGGGEVLSFARAAADLKAGRFVSHPDLACFSDWGEVQDYVSNDAQGDELRLLVDLIDRFDVETIISALGHMPPEDEADLVVSTAHKAKGREWSAVQLSDDFRDPEESEEEPDPAELRLLYVACTRARTHLDAEAVPSLVGKDPKPKQETAA